MSVRGQRYLVSGLMAEPIASAPLRGVALFFHGTRGPGDPAISYLRTVPRGGAAADATPCTGAASCERAVVLEQGEHVLVVTLTQLGYVVLCPDDLGLGSSQAVADQGYMNREIVSAVAIEMMRAAVHRLMGTASAQAGRFRPGRPPEIWLMGGSHGGFITAAVQRRLQEEGERLFKLQATGSFMDAAPIDVSGAMLELFTAPQAYSNPGYLAMVGKSLRAYLPNATPEFEPFIHPAFVGAYHDRSATSAQLNALFETYGSGFPLDAFNATYQATMRDRTSDVYAAWQVAFREHSDLHRGWTPRAPLQHLCTGGADEQVPPNISVAAGEYWNLTTIVLPGLAHTDGIASCLLVAARNMTERALPPRFEPSNHSAMPGDLEALSDLSIPLFAWDRISVATYALALALGFWVVVWLVVCCHSCRLFPGAPGSRTSAKLDDLKSVDSMPVRMVRSVFEHRYVKALSPARLMRRLSPAGSPLGSLARKTLAPHPHPTASQVLMHDAVAGLFQTRAVSGATVRALNCLLGCPGWIVLLALAAVMAPTGLQLLETAEAVLDGEEIFAIDIEDLRSVTGQLTDRQDAYALWSGVGAPSMLTVLTSPPPPLAPSSPSPLPRHPNFQADCWTACAATAGLCSDFCGSGGACCRRGVDTGVEACGFGSVGCDGGHCCNVAAASAQDGITPSGGRRLASHADERADEVDDDERPPQLLPPPPARDSTLLTLDNVAAFLLAPARRSTRPFSRHLSEASTVEEEPVATRLIDVMYTIRGGRRYASSLLDLITPPDDLPMTSR